MKRQKAVSVLAQFIYQCNRACFKEMLSNRDTEDPSSVKEEEFKHFGTDSRTVRMITEDLLCEVIEEVTQLHVKAIQCGHIQ